MFEEIYCLSLQGTTVPNWKSVRFCVRDDGKYLTGQAYIVINSCNMWLLDMACSCFLQLD
jgi:hypothetical protein